MNRFRVLKTFLVAIAVLFGLGLLGVLALHVYGAHRLANASRRYEREVGPLSVRAFVRPRVVVDENAVTWQRPGVLAAVFLNGDQALVGSLSAKRFGTWTQEDTAKLETILERNGPSIELLERARGMKASNWEIPYEEGAEAKIPNLLAAINVAKMLAARGRLVLGRGDRETAIASMETLGALARSHESESATLVVLIGLAIEKLQIALVHELATSSYVTTPELDRLQASLSDEDLTRAVRRSLRGDTAAIAHELGSGPTLMEIHGAIHRRIVSALSSLVAAAAIESHRDLEKAVGAPIRAPLDDAEKRHRGWWEHLLGTYRVNSTSVAARATATASARDLARLAIALRREAFAKGHYPATLPAIDGVPTDDPVTGGARAYDIHADGSAELRSKTTIEIARSISPGLQLFYESLYVWVLPAPRGGRVT